MPAIGDTATWRRLSVAFYSRVDRDPLLRPLFPGKTLHCAIEEFTAFLTQLFGGPSEDTQRRWWLSLHESHLRFRIGHEERAAWLENMVKALDDAQIEEPLSSSLREFFERSSAHVVNRGEPVPAPVGLRPEIARRWEAQLALDEAVAAVRAGEAGRAIAAVESLRSRPSILTGLLARMMGSRNPAMLRYVGKSVAQNPALMQERYASRTLLHQASAQGNLTMVELFPRLGADPNAPDGGGHTPLYCLANEYRGSGGGDVVRALVKSGANVNAADGVKHCTALHMAARRGSREIAEALLDCGADIEARDSLGDTPLRRAVNCGQMPAAALLLARGADVNSRGSKGLTPLSAARTGAMRQLLRQP
jgi:hemoglobin